MSGIHSTWLRARQEAIRLVIEDRWIDYKLALKRNGPIREIASGPARLQRNSALFEYTVTFLDQQRPVALIAKIPRQSGPNQSLRVGRSSSADQGRAEWEQLSKAYPHFAALADGVSVVRPLGYLESFRALLLEKASGCELAKMIGTAQSGDTAPLGRAGRWLSIFHSKLHHQSNREWTPAWYVARLEERKSRFFRPGVSRKKWESTFDRVEQQVQRLSPRDVPWSMLHGDYRLRHIWASPDRIEVLDLGNAHEGDCYADVATLFVELMMVELGRPFVARRRVDAYTRAFLDAYFGGDPPSVFWLYVIDRLFKKWGRWLVRWDSPSNEIWWTPVLQRCVRLIQSTAVTSQLYVNRWFSARVYEALERAHRAW